MPLICYEAKKFNPNHASIIKHANKMITEAKGDGYTLTQRRLYYMFVSRGLLDTLGFPVDPKSGSTNNERSYKKLLNVVNMGRMAGKIDWLGVEDMTRNPR